MFVFITSFAFTSGAGAADVFYNYAKGIGGTESNYGNEIIRDTSGNMYITGGFNGTVDFDPGTGTTELTSVGSSDIFILKLDSSGDFVWAKSVGNSGSQDAGTIAVDSSGNVYVAGGFINTIDFDPGAGTSELTALGSVGGARVFLFLSLIPAGNLFG